MLRPYVLVLALLISGRSLWSGLVTHQMPLLNALIWFLLAYVLAGLATWALRSLIAGYNQAGRSKKLAEAVAERKRKDAE